MLGPGRLPRPEEQRSLPYTSAVLHEVQRFITLLPHVPRCTAADTRLGGYLLPKVGPAQPSLPLRVAGVWSPAMAISGLGSDSPGPPVGIREGVSQEASPPCVPGVLPLPKGHCCMLGSPLCPAAPCSGGLRPPPTGHACDPPADLGAAGQDAVGHTRTVQPGSLPGCRGALCEAGGLPAFLYRSSRGVLGVPLSPSPPRTRHPPAALLSPQAAESASGRAWPGRSSSCCSLASCSGTVCCHHRGSARPPWTPSPPRPSLCGHRPRPCVRCPGPRLLHGNPPEATLPPQHPSLAQLGGAWRWP